MIVRLDQQIDCGTLCKQIAKMVDKYKKENSLDNKVLSIRIVEVVNSDESIAHESREGSIKLLGKHQDGN